MYASKMGYEAKKVGSVIKVLEERLSIAVRQKDPDTDRRSRQHLDGHQYLQRDGHSGL
jgi:hypothetical protein